MKASRSLVLISIVLLFSSPIWGQSVTFSTESVDFGTVLLGDSATLSLTAVSADAFSPLIVTDARLVDDGGGAFSVLDVVASPPDFQYPDRFDFPAVLLPSEFITVYIAYTPNSLGTHTGMLYFECNDHADPFFYIPVTGRSSIPTVPAPGALLLAGLGAGLVGHLRRRRSL